LTDNLPASLWQAGDPVLLLLWVLCLGRRLRRFAGGLRAAAR